MLSPPPADLARQDLPTSAIQADSLFRISGHNSGEPYFGRWAAHRFDDRQRVAAKRYGTCYCGFDLETALAETLLHDEEPRRGLFHLSPSVYTAKYLLRFASRAPLVVADLTGVNLKRLGGTGALSTITPYALPQQWSQAVHRHPRQVDGILYMSRHLNDRRAVVLFDRAGARISVARCVPLPEADGIAGAPDRLGIVFDRP